MLTYEFKKKTEITDFDEH